MATKVSGLRLWEETASEAVNRDFTIQTKLNDFGNPLYKKKIYGWYVNLTQGSSNKVFTFSLYYRENTTDSWKYLGYFSNVSTSASSTTTNSHYYKEQFPGFAVYTLQIKLVGSYVSGDVGINDFGIMYRNYRESSGEKFDET